MKMVLQERDRETEVSAGSQTGGVLIMAPPPPPPPLEQQQVDEAGCIIMMTFFNKIKHRDPLSPTGWLIAVSAGLWHCPT